MRESGLRLVLLSGLRYWPNGTPTSSPSCSTTLAGLKPLFWIKCDGRSSGSIARCLPASFELLNLSLKKVKKALRDVAVNDGLHMSGVALIPPGSRLRQRLDHHLRDNKRLYLQPDSPLCRIHAEPITETPE